MPHLRLDITPNLAERSREGEILRALVARLSSFPTIVAPGVKAYASTFGEGQFAIGDDAPPGFVHLRVEILAGREPALVQEIADGMYAELKAQFAESLESGAAKATMELREMATPTYRK